MITIADRIDTAMRLAGIKTQADLSRISSVPSSSVVRILKGESQPSVENLAAIASACNVSIDWIVTGNDNQKTGAPEVSLVYVTPEELKLLTQFRESTHMGKSLIKTAAAATTKESPIRLPDKP